MSMGSCISIEVPKAPTKPASPPMAQSDSLGSADLAPHEREMLDQLTNARTVGSERQREAFRRFLARGEPGETPYPR